jgi:transcriptional regulator with PAS, ATPase and Fis domain
MNARTWPHTSSSKDRPVVQTGQWRRRRGWRSFVHGVGSSKALGNYATSSNFHHFRDTTCELLHMQIKWCQRIPKVAMIRWTVESRRSEEGCAMVELLGRLQHRLARIAACDSSVLITGETGTGKELVAQTIHALSPRRDGPLVAINCAAIPYSLFESELFGYERGAYTGAMSAHVGKLKLADGGSVFLDEVGEMAASAQVKLLRAIETKEVYRVGGRERVSFDARFIAATNQDMEPMNLPEGFRGDLFFRLAVARVHLPPLRDRCTEIPGLVARFVADLNVRFSRDVEGVGSEVMAAFLHYAWPGNVRELKNLLEATFIDSPSRVFALVDLPDPYPRLLDTGAWHSDERNEVLVALQATRGNKARAARRLHCSRMTLYRKLKKYQLDGALGRRTV